MTPPKFPALSRPSPHPSPRPGRSPRDRAAGRRPRRFGSRRFDDGQATVELALGFPIVIIGVLLVLQLALVGRDQLLVTHASREAARAAATDESGDAAQLGAASASGGLSLDRIEVEDERLGERVRVTVTYQSRTALPIVGAMLPDPVLRSTITVRDETQQRP